MRQAYVTASGIPFRNADLLESKAYENTGRLFLSANVVRLTMMGLFPAIYKIMIPPEGKVIVSDSSLLEGMNTAERAVFQERRLRAGLPEKPDEDDSRERNFQFDPILSHEQHYAKYTSYRQAYKRSPHGLPFTIGVGGFVFAHQEGDVSNDPPQFVLKQDGKANPGVWAQPSGLASGDIFYEMGRHIATQSGIVLLDEKKKIATLVAPEFVVSHVDKNSFPHVKDEYDLLREALKKVDSSAIKMSQLPQIKRELELAGYGGYDMRVVSYKACLNRDKLPPRDKIELETCSLELGIIEKTFKAFVVKNQCGSVNINLPFHIHNLPKDQKLLAIDCEGKGRKASFKTQEQLLTLEKSVVEDREKAGEESRTGWNAVSIDLLDWIKRLEDADFIPKSKPHAALQNIQARLISPPTPTFTAK